MTAPISSLHLYLLNEGDGAFYGPKIDISVSDALSKKFQCATLQLNFQLPDRLKLEFSAEDEAKIERPVMIHRVILGSVEHMFVILLEHYKGKWPFWLSPLQAIVREAQLAQYKYMLVVGEEEANTGQVVWPSEVVVAKDENEVLVAIIVDQEATIAKLEKMVEKLQMFVAKKRQGVAHVGNSHSNKDYDMVVDDFGTNNSQEDYELVVSSVLVSNSKKEIEMEGDDVEKSNSKKNFESTL
ncbi:Threonine--tRNA ligase [Vigna angularis]|uniref:Threonyl-tRNA synthetase n=1 Tax=Phaseolus angularis TaxID=3914 RepID=A0A8T0KEG7_PHAAN|nr:Threonine--tRNA ligase [Vigna angularis]